MDRKPLSRARSPWVEQSLDGDMIPAATDPRLFVRRVGDGGLIAITALEPMGWHLSISFRDQRGEHSRYPNWDEIADARYELLPDDLDFVMHLPPPTEYVAVHDTTFHLHEHPERPR